MKKIYLLLLSFYIFQFACAQTTPKYAWESFLKNDTENAKKAFKELAQNPTTKENAYLGLSLIAEHEQKSEESFQYFQQFLTSAKITEPYLYALWRSSAINDGYGKISQNCLALMNSIAKNKSFDGSINAMACAVIGKHFESSRKIVEADKYYNQIGSIDNWQITSGFENISTSGFDKNYDVLAKPQNDAKFTGKNGLEFGWRKVPYTKHDKWFDLTYYDDPENAIIFAQTFVNVQQPITAQLRIGISGSVKVWVNDKLTLSEPEERNTDLDAYITTLKLNAGYNRILLQVGESYAGRSNFLLRITDSDGQPIPNLTVSTDYQQYTKETAFQPQRSTPKSYSYFAAEIKADSSNYLNKILLAKTYLRDDILFEARNLLEELRTKFPESTYVSTMLALLHSKEDNRTGVTTIQENIKTLDPKSIYALNLFYDEYSDQKNYDKAEEIVNELEQRLGEDESVITKKMQIAGKRNDQNKVIDLVEKAYKRWPDNKQFMYVKYVIEKEVKKSPQAVNVIKKYLNENDDFQYAKFLASAYFEKGDAKSGIDVYLQEIANDPVATGIYSSLANQYYDVQKYDKAEEYFLKTQQLAPFSDIYYKSLGQVYQAKKDNVKAEAAYKKALSINPNSYDAIEKLRLLSNKKDVFDYFGQVDVNQLIKSAPKLQDYPDDHTVILNEEVQVVVHENGGSEEKHYLTVKMLTQKGLEGYKEYGISYDNDQSLIVEVAEVIKSNGIKTPAEQNNNNMVFTNLEVGDVINIRYKLQNYNVGSLASHFWDSFYFTHGTPYVSTKYSLLIHKNKKFNYKFSEKEIAPVKNSTDDFDLYVWEAKNQAALRYEDKMPPQDDVTNILYISTIPDWKFVADWYNNIATAKARSSYEVKTVVNELFAGKKLTELAKIKKIYSYITQNIGYSSVSFRQSGIVPQNPSTVLNTRIGDCKDVSTLFLAMCKETGISAELALVKTRDNGQNTLLLPSIDFNHCIAKAKADGKTYFLELTSNSLPFGTFSNSDLGAPILEINGTTEALTRLNPAQRMSNHINYSTNVIIKNADMMITETNYGTGSAASYLRDIYNNLSNKEQLKKMKEHISMVYPDNEVVSLNFVNLDPKSSTTDTLRAASAYNLINVCKPVAGMSIFELPWSTAAATGGLTVNTPRYFGIDLTQLFWIEKNNERINLTLPEGKKLVEPVKQLTIDNEYFKYTLSTATTGNKVMVNREFVMKKDFVSQDKVAEFHTLYKKIVESDHQQLAIK